MIKIKSKINMHKINIGKKGGILFDLILTYGWAVLLLAACTIAITYFVILEPESLKIKRCEFDGLSCPDYPKGYSALQQIYFPITNNIGRDIRIDSIKSVGTSLCKSYELDNNLLNAGGTLYIKLTECFKLDKGLRFIESITIYYTDARTMERFSITGDIGGKSN